MLVGSALSTTTWAGGRVDVFGVGTNGCIYHKGGVGDGWYQDPWDNLACPRLPITGVSAVSWGSGRVDFFGVGTNAGTYHRWGTPPTAWQQPWWDVLNGTLVSSPTAVSTAANQLDVFGIGTDGGAWSNHWSPDSQWPGWMNLGCPNDVITFTGTLAAVSSGSGWISVFGLGDNDGNIWVQMGLSGDPSSWSGEWLCLTPPAGVGLSFESDPAAVSWGPGRIDVFCVGIDSQIWHNAYAAGENSNMFSGWAPLGGLLISSPCAVSRGTNLIDVLGIGTDGAVWHNAWADNNWSGFVYDLGTPAGVQFVSAPSAVATSNERLDVFVLGSDGNTYHKSWISGSWAQSWDLLKGTIVVQQPPQNIGLNMQYQQMDNWCWVTVATSILKFYDSTSLATQSGIVTQLGPTYNQFPPGTSCLPTPTAFQADPSLLIAWEDPYAPTALYAFDPDVSGVPQICNHGGDVATALQLFGAVSQNYSGQSSISMNQITQELSQLRPIAVGITWNGGGGHTVAIVGAVDNLLLISDPIAGESVIELENFPTLYNGGANSPTFYITQPPQ
jgi:hypothetical protein